MLDLEILRNRVRTVERGTWPKGIPEPIWAHNEQDSRAATQKPEGAENVGEALPLRKSLLWDILKPGPHHWEGGKTAEEAPLCQGWISGPGLASVECARKVGGSNLLPGTDGGKSLSPLPAPKELVSQGSLEGPRREEAASQLAPGWFSRLVCQGGDNSWGRDFSVVISVNEETRRTCLKVVETAQVNNILTL